ncbi:hypothetical protein, partial [Enterobacter cloacae]|uniref:hypothetical protein n=1 Tax=Enterobacter cloacae TaxID=550 RepID=UPI0032DB12C6
TVLFAGSLNNRQRNFCWLHITNATEPYRKLIRGRKASQEKMTMCIPGLSAPLAAAAKAVVVDFSSGLTPRTGGI